MVTLTRSTGSESPQPVEMSAGQQTVPAPRGAGPLAAFSALVAGRAPLVALLATVVLAGAGGLGYLMLTGSDDGDTATGSVVRTVPSHRPSTSPSASASASPRPTGSSSAGPTHNPFLKLAGGGSSASGTGTSTSGATGVGVSTGATTGATGSPATSTRAAIPTVTTTRMATTTRTVTSTVSSAVYLGLYGWTSGGLPMFRVNDVAVTPAVGDTFGTGGAFTYLSSYTSNGLNCATVAFTHVANSVGLCEGEVRKVA